MTAKKDNVSVSQIVSPSVAVCGCLPAAVWLYVRKQIPENCYCFKGKKQFFLSLRFLLDFCRGGRLLLSFGGLFDCVDF